MNHLPLPLKPGGVSRIIYWDISVFDFSLISSPPIQAGNQAYGFIASDNFIGEESYDSFFLCSVNAQHIDKTMGRERKGREFLEIGKKQRSVTPAIIGECWWSAVWECPGEKARPQGAGSMLH